MTMVLHAAQHARLIAGSPPHLPLRGTFSRREKEGREKEESRSHPARVPLPNLTVIASVCQWPLDQAPLDPHICEC